MASVPPPEKRERTFASTVQLALIFLLALSFVLITQRFDRQIYYWGVFLLIVFTLLQIAFGNIPSEWNFARSMMGLVLAALIITGLVVLSIALVPTLINLGR
ncbi:MAG: hypothetical protein KJ065_26970 [Anaerolineae bacterium]|nr:hypothetical protein [Anaerolineae bacterium]